MLEREYSPSISLEFTAPEFLTPQDNFFNQPPFDFITPTAEKYGVSPLAAQELLHSIVNWKGNRRDLSITQQANALISSINSLTPLLKRVYLNERESMGHTLVELGHVLKQYPKWAEYIRAKKDKGLYMTTGERKLQQKYQHPTPTYAAWITQEIIHDRRIQDAAARMVTEEAFPQQFGGQSPSDIASSTGKRTYRKYIITLTAAGLDILNS